LAQSHQHSPRHVMSYKSSGGRNPQPAPTTCSSPNLNLVTLNNASDYWTTGLMDERTRVRGRVRYSRPVSPIHLLSVTHLNPH